MRRLLTACLLVVAALPAAGQPDKKMCPKFSPKSAQGSWQWMDRDCRIRTRGDLDKILANHKSWVAKYGITSLFVTEIPESEKRDPLRADLSEANLGQVDLTGAILEGADLTGTNLDAADLTGASLRIADLAGAALFRADLTGANLFGADLTGSTPGTANLTRTILWQADPTGAFLPRTDLTGTILFYTNLAGADLEGADLTDANLLKADLTGAILTGADLTRANLFRADLTGASLVKADLSDSRLEETDLSSADLTNAQLWNAEFEPKVVPSASGIARAEGLSTLRWNPVPKQTAKLPFWKKFLQWFGDRRATGNRNPMQDMRKTLHDAGYVEAEGQVNLAYHRMEQQWWQEVLFDWTCEWGSNWKRPLGLVVWLGFGFSFVYWVLVRFTRSNRLYLVRTIGKKDQRRRIGWRDPSRRPNRIPWRRRMRWEVRLYLTALLFSFTSVLNLGVQGLNFGRWVRLVYQRDFELQARGWIRTVAGIQSLASVALLALAVVSYLGHPIE
jgi:uncharacterized protein YjbI with pentapeptide repeats